MKDWQPVTDREATPRGYTPLFDAIGPPHGLASADTSNKASVIIVTDGQENASREVTREGAKAMLDRAREKGWDVVFLGANFDAFSQAASLGTAAAHTLNIAPGSMRAAMAGPMAARAEALREGAAPKAFSEGRPQDGLGVRYARRRGRPAAGGCSDGPAMQGLAD